MIPRSEAFAAKLQLAGGSLPVTITDLVIEVRHSQVGIERGLPAQLKDDVGETLRAIGPLLAAGFAGGGPSSTFKLKLGGDASGIRITISGAGHTALLPYILLRMIEAQCQTPAGAYEYLLDLLDGDEDAAKEAFSPLDVTADIAAVVVTAPGEPRFPFSITKPPMRPDLPPLTATINIEDDRQVFAVPSADLWTDAVEHGFLTLLGLGVFVPFTDLPHGDGEPQIFTQGNAGPGAQIIVDDWSDDPAFLAELLRVVAGGDPGAVRRVQGED